MRRIGPSYVLAVRTSMCENGFVATCMYRVRYVQHPAAKRTGSRYIVAPMELVAVRGWFHPPLADTRGGKGNANGVSTRGCSVRGSPRLGVPGNVGRI